MRLPRFFLALVLMVAAFLGASATAQAQQTPQSNVSVVVTTSQSSTSAVDPETVGGEVEVQAQLGDSKFMLDNTTSFNVSEDGYDSGHSFSNTALLRFYPNKHVFLGVGARLARQSDRLDSLNTVNPALTAGLNFDIGKVSFEPYALVLTDDLNNNTRGRSLGGGLQVQVPFSERAGLKLVGTGARNSYASGFGRVEANNFAAGAGFYINF